MDLGATHLLKMLQSLSREVLPGGDGLKDFHDPVRHWLEKRSHCLGDPPTPIWILEDPIVKHLAPVIYGILGRRLAEDGKEDWKVFAQAYSTALEWWTKNKRCLDEILLEFDQQGVEVILLKGAAFQRQLYQNCGLRPMGDLDLLVKEVDFKQAASILVAKCFTLGPHNRLAGSLMTDLQSLDSCPVSAWPAELTFVGEEGVKVDLHRHLLGTPWFLPAYTIDMPGIWARSEVLPVGDGPCHCERSLSGVDTLAFLCLHEAMHGLQALQTYLDIDLWIRNLPQTWEWDQFIELVNRWKLRSAAYHALFFSQFMMDTPLPVGLLSRLDPGWAARLRIKALITPETLLANQLTLGRRYPTLIKLFLVDSLGRIAKLSYQALFPDWERYSQPQVEKISRVKRWKHVWEVIRRGD